ncbi:MAG: 3-keto-disaccharide hydrolase [Mucilaginibacter sp.]
MSNNKKYCLAIAVFAAGVLLFSDCNAQTTKGWTNLFDGKTLKGWKQATGNATYTVRNGQIVGTSAVEPHNSFLVTEKEYGDFILELDTKVDDKVSNSGIQTRSHFDPNGNDGTGRVYGRQVEIDPSDRRWTGGIEDEARRDWLYTLQYNPKAQPAFKQGEWNHLKIECIGNTTKTWVNGVAAAYVVDTIDSKGFIGLQVHAVGKSEDAGKKIYFKNIRIKTTNLKLTPFPPGIFVVNYVSNRLTDYEMKDGWRLLFDGKTNTGWRSATSETFPTKPGGWVVKDGTMTILGSKGGEAANVGDIVTNEQFSAFDLSFEYKMSTGANSGVKYFVTLQEDTKGQSAIGLEYQILDDKVHPDAKLGRNGDRTLASLYDLIPANKPPRFVRPIGAWNTGRIIVYSNNHVEHYLNGIKVLEYERGSKEFKDLVAISKYVIWKNFGEAKQGHILLQDHGFEVNFRSIKIKELK